MNLEKNKLLLVSIIIPFLALIFLTFYKAYSLSVGVKITLPISGYDPRDILTGHYVTYRIEYGIEDLCAGSYDTSFESSCVCLFDNSSENFFKNYCSGKDDSCPLFIKGKCENGRFTAQVERFNIPEAKASEYDKKVRSGKSKVVLSVKKDGSAMVERLILADE